MRVRDVAAKLDISRSEAGRLRLTAIAEGLFVPGLGDGGRGGGNAARGPFWAELSVRPSVPGLGPKISGQDFWPLVLVSGMIYGLLYTGVSPIPRHPKTPVVSAPPEVPPLAGHCF